MKRDRCTKEQAKAKVAAQMRLGVKQAKANLVIDNSGDLDYVQRQVCHAVIFHTYLVVLCAALPHVAALTAPCTVSLALYSAVDVGLLTSAMPVAGARACEVVTAAV